MTETPAPDHAARLDALGVAIEAARARVDRDVEAPEIGDLLETLNDELGHARAEDAAAAAARLDRIEAELAGITERLGG